jgi:hypothetical protein
LVDGADQAEEGYDEILGYNADAANAIFEARGDIHLGLHRHRHAGLDGRKPLACETDGTNSHHRYDGQF